MPRKKTALSPITVLMIITVMAALATWFLPAGKYDKLTDRDNLHFLITTDQGDSILPFDQKTLDSLHILIRLKKFENGSIRKPVSIPGTFHIVAKNREGPVSVLQAPIQGIYEAIDIFLFILLLGSFINIFQESGALVSGLQFLSHRMKGKEKWLIILLTLLYTFAGSSYGMQEEALIFYPVITPIFLAAGFDLIIPVAVIFGGTQLGYFSSFTNPFSTILASNAAGVSWTDGLNERIENTFIKKFIRGAEGMLSVAIIVGVARGITIILKDGNISDTILFYVSSWVIHFPPVLFILMILGLFLILSIFISSSSAMAVLTMPILGGLAVIIGIPGREIVNSYLFGMGILGFIAPSGLILPSLAIANVNYKAWWRFIFPFLIFLLVMSVVFLIIGLKQ